MNILLKHTRTDVPHTLALATIFLLGEKPIKPNETIHIK